MEHFSVDAYTPAEIAARIEKASISKSNTEPSRVFALAMLAGAFIAFGAIFFTLVTQQAGGLPVGILRLVGGLAFCLGLILVVVAGAELFTGNNLLVMACVERKISLWQLLTNWGIVYLGNFAGALVMVFLIYWSGHWLLDGGMVGTRALAIAKAKLELDFLTAFTRGVLCNALVCLAIWLCFASHSVTDKILAILFPITAFVAMGFEHSVANMYFIPAGMALTHHAEFMEITGQAGTDLANLTLGGFLWKNLLPVTLGNVAGGGGLVGLVYWFIYVRK